MRKKNFGSKSQFFFIILHPLFQIIDDWYDENQKLDTDMLDTMLRLFICMAPLSTHRSYSLSVREAIIIRSLFIDMCALTTTLV